MSFETDGFLSPEIERFRLYVRGHDPSKKWFELADDLNRLTLELLQKHQTPLDDRQRFTFSGLFVRAHQSFQAALILIERGMIGDARAVLDYRRWRRTRRSSIKSSAMSVTIDARWLN